MFGIRDGRSVDAEWVREKKTDQRSTMTPPVDRCKGQRDDGGGESEAGSKFQKYIVMIYFFVCILATKIFCLLCACKRGSLGAPNNKGLLGLLFTPRRFTNSRKRSESEE